MNPAPAGEAAALLIDADNLSPDNIERAVAHMREQGWRLTLKRAYGGHEKLAGMRDCLLRHGVRGMVNHGKGTTDALLVVDTMDLLHASRLPGIVAIASSDADFAPLAVRLREAGIQVVCFADAGKSADADLARCYDSLVHVNVAPATAEPARAKPARKRAASTRRAPAAPPDPLRRLLESFEGLSEGRQVALNDIVQKLRADGLLGRSASGATFLRKNAPYLELSPEKQPNKVRLRDTFS